MSGSRVVAIRPALKPCSTRRRCTSTSKTRRAVPPRGGKPPEGTHTAENAPNFAGGPGADRTYGIEEEEPPKGSRRCKCSKCGALKVLPKGSQCEDLKCPACGSGMAQTEPRRDKPAGGEEGRAPGAGRRKAVHGEGSMLGEVTAVMGQDGNTECKCPHCGKAIPCTAKACPYCKEKIDRVDRGEDEKRAMKSEGDGKHPASHYLVVEDPE